jgi:hypothetical protein
MANKNISLEKYSLHFGNLLLKSLINKKEIPQELKILIKEKINSDDFIIKIIRSLENKYNLKSNIPLKPSNLDYIEFFKFNNKQKEAIKKIISFDFETIGNLFFLFTKIGIDNNFLLMKQHHSVNYNVGRTNVKKANENIMNKKDIDTILGISTRKSTKLLDLFIEKNLLEHSQISSQNKRLAYKINYKLVAKKTSQTEKEYKSIHSKKPFLNAGISFNSEAFKHNLFKSNNSDHKKKGKIYLGIMCYLSLKMTNNILIHQIKDIKTNENEKIIFFITLLTKQHIKLKEYTEELKSLFHLNFLLIHNNTLFINAHFAQYYNILNNLNEDIITFLKKSTIKGFNNDI